jgi:hypothetical protein
MRGLAYSNGDAFRVVAGNEGVIQLDHLTNHQSVRLATSGDDWVVYTLDGLFDASTTGSWLVAAVEGGRAFRIDQVAHKNNRPDVILSRFGVGAKELVDHLLGRVRNSTCAPSWALRVIGAPARALRRDPHGLQA